MDEKPRILAASFLLALLLNNYTNDFFYFMAWFS